MTPPLLPSLCAGTFFGNAGAIVAARPDFKSNISNGLCGYDAALIGCAVWSFMSSADTKCVTAIFLSFLSGVLHMSFTNIMKTFGLPALTTSFNVIILLAFISVIKQTSTTLRFSAGDAPVVSQEWESMSLVFFLDLLFRGVSQFMFIGTTAGGVLAVVGIGIVSQSVSHQTSPPPTLS